MTEYSRQTTLDSSHGKISGLEDVDWTFENHDTRYLTHGLHSYPARMIPQIPSTLFDYYKNQGIIEDGDTVYDPFSGSGTTAVEARLHGLHAESNDINPLACMLSLTKTTPIEPHQLDEARDMLFSELEGELRDIREQYNSDGTIDIEEPEVRDGWFPEPQLYELCYIRNRIDDLEKSDTYTNVVARFFRIALSKITRQISYQRNGEYKRYRLAEEDRGEHTPDVFSTFRSCVEKNTQMMKRYSNRVDFELSTVVHYADSRIAEDVETNSADIVITSPPYGDHRTTVAYGQFSQDPAIIAGQYGYDEMKQVDKTGLGGANRLVEPLDELEQWSPSLRSTLGSLREKEGRAKDAMEFFRDYYEVMKQVARILKPGQPVAWVVANRTMSRVNIPTHLITKELCEQLGFEYVKTLPRKIPTKTLPWENAPENETGNKGNLMADENIVILHSPSSKRRYS